MFIVPALAATLVGNFRSIWLTVVAGIAIGALQAETTNLQATFDWFPRAGMAEAIPLLLILVFLVFKGRPLPDRGSIVRQRLGHAPRPERIVAPALLAVAVAVVALMVTGGSYRAAIITSIIFAVIALSQVVVTGYTGRCRWHSSPSLEWAPTRSACSTRISVSRSRSLRSSAHCSRW